MAHLVLSRSFSEVVSYEEAKRHLRLWDDDQQLYVQSLIDAAVSSAEKYLNRLIIESTVLVTVDHIDNQLPLGKAKSVEEVTYYLPDGSQHVLEPSAYVFSKVRNKVILNTDARAHLRSIGAHSFEVTMVTGWSADEIPADVKHAVLMLVATLFEMREDATVGQGVMVINVPITHRYLLNKHKIAAV
ncbi:head-tail connector protein [Vibrio parahaemolyticus]|uniref:head-tail connector protein n=1 Tax=Vibrio parahaemolyticus TaxID=670 RepID=UPI0008D95BD3|nr:phage head-tail connector protein [Vibrio parahaemolyticus]OHX45653.1 hypothetical protein BB048_01260 [Vibrio parahaemolyticus]